MPQIEVTTGRRAGEPESRAIERARYIAGRAKTKMLSRPDAIRVFDGTPAIQTIGDEVILRWHYKQYPKL